MTFSDHQQLQLRLALELAFKYHEGQVDLANKPYIGHVLRVMKNTTTADGMIVALLHDIVEDTPLTFSHLRRYGFSHRVIEAVHLLTKTPGSNYKEYIENISTNRLASEVKLADLKDNTDTSRMKLSRQKDLARQRKYRKAIETLRKALT